MKKPPEVSYVVPVFNEAESVAHLLGALEEAGQDLGAAFEAVLVDDGSTDASWRELEALAPRYPFLRAIQLAKNYGQSAAMAAGIAQARGQFIVTLDGDLQNDPRDGKALLAHLVQNDLDVVSGWRANRQDATITRNLPSWLANRLICAVTQVSLHDTGCSLKVYRADIAKRLPLYGEMHRFLPALAAMEGARLGELPVSHHARRFGHSKYNLSRTFKVIVDLLAIFFFQRYLTRPMHLFGREGFGLAAFGVFIWLFCMVCALLMGMMRIPANYFFLAFWGLVALLLFLFGLQWMAMGLISEQVSRLIFSPSPQPPYRIRRQVSAE